LFGCIEPKLSFERRDPPSTVAALGHRLEVMREFRNAACMREFSKGHRTAQGNSSCMAEG